MRHKKGGRKLNRTSSHRKAMLRNMVTSLLEHGRIRTTEAKAKEVRRLADKVITLSKRVPMSRLDACSEGDERQKAEADRLHAIRQARKWVHDRDVLHKVFSEYGDAYANRDGGYTRLLKLGRRAGDNAPMSLVELVEGDTRSTPVVDEAATQA